MRWEGGGAIPPSRQGMSVLDTLQQSINLGAYPRARPFEKKIVGVTDPRPRDELIDKSAIFPSE